MISQLVTRQVPGTQNQVDINRMLNIELIYSDYIAAEREKYERLRDDYKGWLGASSAGYCYKKQYYKLSEVEAEEPNHRVSRLLRLGTIVHSDVENAILLYNKTNKDSEMFKDIETEKRIKISKYKVLGHMDIYEEDGDIKRIYDLKTVASYKWRKKFGRKNTDPNADVNYNLQLGTYGLGVSDSTEPLTNTELYLCWYNKDNSMMKDPVKVDSIWISSAETYWAGLRDALELYKTDNLEPDQVPTGFGAPMQQWECNYCQYSYRCNSPYIKNKGRR